MTELVKESIQSQMLAALAMLHRCVMVCPDALYEGKIANSSFRQIVYHTLFFTELYLGREATFELRAVHTEGGDERGAELSPGLSKEKTLAYIREVRERIGISLASETAETLAGESGFSRRKFSRLELHLYNLRHVQHHTGQCAAYLRRQGGLAVDPDPLPWVGAGWRE